MLRLRKLHYADVVAAKEQYILRSAKCACTSKELIKCILEMWEMRSGTIGEEVSDKIALANSMAVAESNK